MYSEDDSSHSNLFFLKYRLKSAIDENIPERFPHVLRTHCYMIFAAE